MKAAFLLTAVQNGAKRILMGLVLAVAVMLPHLDATAGLIPAVDLASASNFAVLAGAGITIAPGPTTITGDLGTYPTLTITGLGNVTLNGSNHFGDAVTQQAKIDLVTAYDDATGRSATTSYGAVDLVGLTLTSGVYNGSSTLAISGTLTLDAQGNPDAVWIFQAGSTLTTASGSSVVLTNGAQACNVFWQVGSSATLGTYSVFKGTIMAHDSITMTTGVTVDGRVLARNGTVALDTNIITVPRHLHRRGTIIMVLDCRHRNCGTS